MTDETMPGHVGSQTGELASGTIFVGRYEVLEPIAEGERRRTYLAKDKRLEKTVALSVVRPECVHLDPEGVEREAKVLGSIGSHDNIVSVSDYVVEGPVQFVVLEYMGGGTLADHISKEGPLPLDSLLRFGRQVCRGLAHLHEHGLIHRDVAAKNVLLDGRGEAHLGDFDSAIRVEDAGSEHLPVTPNPSVAPEDRPGSALDCRSDLYSFGCLLCLMALGVDALGSVEELRVKRPDLPSSFADLVERLLADSSDDRPEDADAVLLWLDDIRNTSNVEALISAGEGSQVEFKASLHHPYDPLPEGLRSLVTQGKYSHEQAMQEWQQGLASKNVPLERALKELQGTLNWEVTKSIAAFLNTEGGMLLIGVSDAKHILGIEADFDYLDRKRKQDADGWLLSFQQLVINALGADSSNVVRVSLVSIGGATVAVVSCPRRSIETWHRKDGKQVFYVRAGNQTVDIEGPELLKYVREHWAA